MTGILPADQIREVIVKVNETTNPDYGFSSLDNLPIEHLLKKRGELAGKNRISDKHVKKTTDFSTIKQLAKGLAEGKIKLTEIPELQPVFRLNPPRKGFKSLKYAVTAKGDLGYRGEAINDLIARMA